MNFINRVIVVMLLLAALVLGCVSFIIVLIARGAIAATLQPTLSAISDSNFGAPQLLCLGVALLFAVFSILLLYLELMPSSKMRMRLKSIQGAEVMLSADSITTQLEYALDPLPGVIRVHPKVTRGKGDAVDVLIDMITPADVDIKKKTDEVMDVARTVLEGSLGLRVGKVQIKMEQTKPAKRSALNLPPLELPRLVSDKLEQDKAEEDQAKAEEDQAKVDQAPEVSQEHPASEDRPAE